MADIKSFEVLDIRTISKVEKEAVSVEVYDETIFISSQKTGYGKKLFFDCPKCDNRREKIYIVNRELFYCRSCLPKKLSVYRGVTHTTKGGTGEIQYRMERLAAQYKIPLEYPFNYISVMMDRPKYYRVEKWDQGMRKLQILENMRGQSIYMSKRYEINIINKALENHLKDYTLLELQRYFYDWHRITNK